MQQFLKILTKKQRKLLEKELQKPINKATEQEIEEALYNLHSRAGKVLLNNYLYFKNKKER